MILTNIETLPGMKIVGHYGMVSGSTVRAKNFAKDMLAGMKKFCRRWIKRIYRTFGRS